MYYVLVHYPKFDGKIEEDIEAFRRKYDPFVDSWKPHIPIIFPIACSEVEGEKLAAHIETVLKNWEPFPYRGLYEVLGPLVVSYVKERKCRNRRLAR